MSSENLPAPLPEPPPAVPDLAILGASPEEVVERATRVAQTLADVVRQGNLSVRISGREYVKCEGWTTLVSMLGIFPKVTDEKRTETPEGLVTWEAAVELVHVGSQRLISRGTALASGAERKPWTANEFSIRSMAQTRATGKACRLAFSWIMTLAGYEATPADEMPHEEKPTSRPAPPRSHQTGAGGTHSPAPPPLSLSHPESAPGGSFPRNRATPGSDLVDLAEFTIPKGYGSGVSGKKLRDLPAATLRSWCQHMEPVIAGASERDRAKMVEVRHKVLAYLAVIPAPGDPGFSRQALKDVLPPTDDLPTFEFDADDLLESHRATFPAKEAASGEAPVPF